MRDQVRDCEIAALIAESVSDEAQELGQLEKIPKQDYRRQADRQRYPPGSVPGLRRFRLVGRTESRINLNLWLLAVTNSLPRDRCFMPEAQCLYVG